MVLVDTIPADRFEKTKIKGAVNAGLPKEMKDLKPEEKEAFLKTLGDNKDKKIVIYCGFVACERSNVGAVLAKKLDIKMSIDFRAELPHGQMQEIASINNIKNFALVDNYEDLPRTCNII